MTDRSLERLPVALTAHVGYLLVVLGKRAQRAFSDALEPDGLRPPHFDILACLDQEGARSQSELAKVLSLEPAHLVTLLDELEREGLVARAPDPADRRRYAVALTTAGVAATKRLAATSQAVEVGLLSALSASEQAQLRGLLQRLTRKGPHPSHELATTTPPTKPRAPRSRSARR